MVRETEALLAPELSRRAIGIVNQVAAEATVPIGARSLKQILLNLILNAAEAVGEKGTIRVSLEMRGKEVELAVEDDGPGMNEEVRRRALDPFFTTKPTGSGPGSTLVTSLLVARGGRLEIQPAHPRGTRMKVLLPRTLAEGRGARRMSDRPDRFRVLVVDDEAEIVRDLATSWATMGSRRWRSRVRSRSSGSAASGSISSSLIFACRRPMGSPSCAKRRRCIPSCRSSS
ncbi:MAG: ATP-binding protein [Candidatus Eisenbacteria bacterium]